MIQALQENAGRFASMVSAFCQRLGWSDLEGLVAKFQNRVSFGVRAEIAELTSIPFVKVWLHYHVYMSCPSCCHILLSCLCLCKKMK
jgi:DNA polymerase theta